MPARAIDDTRQAADIGRHTFVLAMWEGGGNVPPELGFARRLIERGHRVHVLGDPTIEPEARAAGCGFSAWEEAPSCAARTPEAALIHDWEDKSMMESLRTYLEDFLCGPAARYARDTLRVIDEVGADVVLCDMVMIGPSMAAELRGLPRFSLMPNIYMFPVKGLPPMGPGFMPARGPVGHLRDWVMRAMTAKMFNKGTPTLNKARAELGLEPIGSLLEQFLHVDRMFVLTAAAFEFPSEHFPANVMYVGPMLDDPAWSAPSTVSALAWPAGNDDPLVLVSLSSGFQDQGALLRRIIAAMATLPVRAIVTLGEQLAADDFIAAPNVAIVQSAAHGPILREAAAVVTHCGHGTAIKAMCEGVPAVCVPMGRDQNDTAARIVARHAGVRRKTKASVAQIAAATRTVLDDPKYRQGARTLGERINAERASIDPVGVLLTLLDGAAVAS